MISFGFNKGNIKDEWERALEVMGSMADLLYVNQDHFYDESPKTGRIEAPFHATVKMIYSFLPFAHQGKHLQWPLVCNSWTQNVAP